jgi:hypothetical protein
LDAKRTIK